MQEINDLKNIVIQSLESNGVLSQLRAQIRSSVFKIIEDQESREGRSPAFFWENPLCQKIHKTMEGPIALELMHEFMEFYRMDFTCNVFVHEANYKATTERQALGTRSSPSQQTQHRQRRPLQAAPRHHHREARRRSHQRIHQRSPRPGPGTCSRTRKDAPREADSGRQGQVPKRQRVDRSRPRRDQEERREKRSDARGSEG
jgi:hypothetical protein